MKNVLKDLFKSRIIRFSLLGCILFGLGIYFYTQRELKRFEESLPKAPQLVSSTTATTAENENAVAPTENAEDGHENDGASHAAPPTVVAKPFSQREQIAVEMGLISAEEIDAQEKAKREFYASHGLEPPPPGYRYAKIGDGTPQLVKDKDPIIKVVWGESYENYHQLTDIELVRYRCLLAIDRPSVIKRYGLSQEEVNLGLVWKQELYEKTKGPRPTITAHLSYPASNPLTDQEKEAVYQRMRDREDELVPRPRKSLPINDDDFDAIIAEIRETLSRR